jgi:hypothetical protein
LIASMHMSSPLGPVTSDTPRSFEWKYYKTTEKSLKQTNTVLNSIFRLGL